MEIKNRFTGEVIFKYTKKNFIEKIKENLANLSGADLSGIKLWND